MTRFKEILPKVLPTGAALLLFFIVSALYFAPQFRGEVLPQHDVQQYEGMAKEIWDNRAQTGEDPQWAGRMFGGMPAYLINVAYPAQLVKNTAGQIVKIINTPAAFVFFAMVSMWLMLPDRRGESLGRHHSVAHVRPFDLLFPHHRRGSRDQNVGTGICPPDDGRRMAYAAG